MKPKTLILMVVAVSCGLGASYMTSRLLADRESDVEKVQVLIAKKTLNMGDILKTPEDLFDVKMYPSGEEPKAAITEIDKLRGRQLKRSLRNGDFVTADDLIDGKTESGLKYILPPGHQAVGIRVTPESIAGGFASLPHSRVNIIWTMRGGTERASFAKILLENILVLAADTSTRVNENGQAMPANVVTVALKPEDVLKIELAKSMGTVALALRGFNDSSRSPVEKVDGDGLRTGTVQGLTNAEEPVETSGAPPVSLPALTPIPKTGATQPKEGDPDFQNFKLHIIEGDQQRSVNFKLDPKSKEVINDGVRRSNVPPGPQISPAPPAPDAVPPKKN